MAVGQTLTLDHCFTGLERDADGLASSELGIPGGRRVTRLWLDDTYDYVMVFTGDTTADVARRGVAIEPMTCPPNAFRSGEALQRTRAGTLVLEQLGLSPRSAAGDIAAMDGAS